LTDIRVEPLLTDDSAPFILLDVPRVDRRVRAIGGAFSIKGKMITDLEVSHDGNPQGMIPFAFKVYFKVNGIQFTQVCSNTGILNNDLMISEAKMED